LITRKVLISPVISTFSADSSLRRQQTMNQGFSRNQGDALLLQ
jgi:hypothetical protein